LLENNPFAGKANVKPTRNEETYDLQALNTSVPINQILEAVQQFYSLDRKLGDGLNLLFHGSPGTGKTELVKYLGSITDKELIVRRGSDLLSMWLGETEKQIAAAFEEAEKAKGILLIDEADSFFKSRETSDQSYEARMVNELLTHMENHSTVFVCCTNLIDRFDAASLRRFHFKTAFFPLRAKDRVPFFRRYFSDLLHEIPDQAGLEDALNKIHDLTPGDFRAVRQRIRYQADRVAWIKLTHELTNEARCRANSTPRTIGFT